MSAGELKGVYSSPNLPTQLKDYVERSVQAVFNVNAKIKSLPKYRATYQQVMLQSLTDVRRTVDLNAVQFRDAEWNPSNQNTYSDKFGVSYRKDGTILVVVTDAYESRSVGPAGNIFVRVRHPSSPAEFDSTFNRIVITPVFAELLRQGRVRTLGQDGKYYAYKLDDVIHHEWAHSGDLGYDERTLRNKVYDNNAEIAEKLGQLVEGRPVRADHGEIQYQALDGSWVAWNPKGEADRIKVNELTKKVAADLGLSEAGAGSPSDKSHKGLDGGFFDQGPAEDKSFNLLTAVGQLADKVLVLDGGQIGAALGSVLGNRLTADPFGRVVASGALGTAMGAVGEFIDKYVFAGASLTTNFLGARVDQVTKQPIKSFGENLGQTLLDNIKGAGIGAISSYMMAELSRAIGISGAVGEIGNSFGGAVISQVISNLPNVGASYVAADGSTKIHTLFENVNPALIANVAASYLGSKLAATIYQPQSVGGQIGSAVGSAYGSFVGGQIIAVSGLNPATFAAAVVAVALWTVVGGLIGSVFGGTPRSGADASWDEAKQQFVVANVYARKGGSKDAAQQLAGVVAANLNAILNASGGKLLNGSAVQTGNYGMRNKEFVYRPTSTTDKDAITARFSGKDGGDRLATHGTYLALSTMLGQLAGGDVFVKRATSAVLAGAGGPAIGSAGAGAAGQFDMPTLVGAFSAAKDYGRYRENATAINALVAADPSTAFAASWMATLSQAIDLGMNRRSASDWVGGYSVFLDETGDGKVDGASLRATQLTMGIDSNTGLRFWFVRDNDGSPLGYVEDTIEAGSQTSISGTSGNDTIRLAGAQLLAKSNSTNVGLMVDGVAFAGAVRAIEVAATIEAGAGDDVVHASDRGDNVSGGAGNDTLYGGRLDDWLFGGDGNDNLDAGAQADSLGGDGNYLDGGAGNDVLRGREGSDWLQGGDGADLLYGGAGDDVLAGGAGSGDQLRGGAGSDQYIVHRGDGADLIEESASVASASSGDAIAARMAAIEKWKANQSGGVRPDWVGNAAGVSDGRIDGGEDAVVFGAGIGVGDVRLQRSNVGGIAGSDLIITITEVVDGKERDTDTVVTLRNWFSDSFQRVEWLKFADGNELRIGDVTSFIIGGAGNDVLIGTAGNDFIYGGAGNDKLYGLGGNDIANGGTGDDFVSGGDDKDLVIGGLGNDELIGGKGNDVVTGDAGRDDVYGGAGDDIVSGGVGDGDQVVGGAGDDRFKFARGDGRDTIFDEFVASGWTTVMTGGAWSQGYATDASGTVTYNGEVVRKTVKTESGGYRYEWFGRFDYDPSTGVLKRYQAPASGSMVANAGTDTLEFAPGIDIQDVILRRSGNDLVLAIGDDNAEIADTAKIADSVTIKDWFVDGLEGQIEKMAFYQTGILDTAAGKRRLMAGTDVADTGFAGTTGNDWMTAGSGDDIVMGGSGDDIIAGNSGSDVLRGEAGNDVLYGGTGNDVLDGGAGADVLVGGNGFDVASYASATKSLRAFLSAAWSNSGDAIGDEYNSIEGLVGGAGSDSLGGDTGANELVGGLGNDGLRGGAGDDVYVWNAGDGNDNINDAPFTIEQVVSAEGYLLAGFTTSWTSTGVPATGGTYWRLQIRNSSGTLIYDYDKFVKSGTSPAVPIASEYDQSGWLLGYGRVNGQIVAGAIYNGSISGGNDTLQLGAGLSVSDFLFEWLGNDLILRKDAGTVHQIRLGGQINANYRIETLQLADGAAVSLASVLAAATADQLTGTTGADLLLGRYGTNVDNLSGGDGNDFLAGYAGDDFLYGGAGDDTFEGGAGADRIDGGGNAVIGSVTDAGDTVRYVRSSEAVVVNLANSGAQSGGEATGDILIGIENVVGSMFADTLTGDTGGNRLAGLDGNDMLTGQAGDDVLLGDGGDDKLYGGDGADALAGGEGADQLWGGNDDDRLDGGDGADALYGEAGKDTLTGGGDDDVLEGGAGDDLLSGDAGKDTLSGGDGNDVLAGGVGDDSLSGGAGDDSYVFGAATGSDQIVDASGVNVVTFDQSVSFDRLWMTRSGNDLKIAVIGGDTNVTISGFFSGTAAMRSVQTATHAYYLDNAASRRLIEVMTAVGNSTPVAMPTDVATQLASYWHAGGKAAPTVTSTPRSIVAIEDRAVTITGDYGVIDHDGGVITYSIKQDSLPTLGNLSGLNASTGALIYTPRANLFGSDAFSLLATDADGQSVEIKVVVSIAPVNDAPGAISVVSGALAVAESGGASGTSAGTLIAKFQSVDVDGDVVTFSLADDAGGRFSVTADGQLTVAKPWLLNYEDAAQHDIIVRASDGKGAATSNTFTVKIDDVNERNELPASYSFAVNENVALGKGIGNVAASDLDLASRPYGQQRYYFLASGTASAVSSDGRYTINASTGAITTAAALNYEGTNPSATYVVIARDNAGNAPYNQISTNVTIGIADVNEAPTAMSWSPSSISVAERDRVAAGTTLDAVALAAFSVTDPDTAASAFATYTYTVSDSRFEFVGNSLRLKRGAVLDYEAGSTISIDVTASDTSTSPFSIKRTVAINVTNVDDVLQGDDNANVLTGQQNRDLIYGFGGADVLDGGAGDDMLDGGAGNDRLLGGTGIDELLGGNDADVLLGGAGADILRGGSGNDTLYGDDGDDLLQGGDGDDTLYGGAGADRFEGGAGTDRVDYTLIGENSASVSGVVADLAGTTANAGLAIGDSYSGVEQLRGSQYGDTLRGDDAGNTLIGEGGADILEGRGGDDLLDGGAGDDYLHGGAGNDYLYGGSGDDDIYGGAGNDYLYGGDGNDELYAESGDDSLDGGAGDDILNGGADNDTYRMSRTSGADTIYNYDATGTDVDVIGLQDTAGTINDRDLWFERSGSDMIVSVVGTTSSARIIKWYDAAGVDRANYKIDFIVAGNRFSKTINVEALVNLMATQTRPTSEADRDRIMADSTYKAKWATYWGTNALPTISEISDQVTNEDEPLSITVTATDDITPAASVVVSAEVIAGSSVNPTSGVSVGAAGSDGRRQLTIRPLANASGSATIRVKATDAGGVTATRDFAVTVKPVADFPTISSFQGGSGNSGTAVPLTIAVDFPDKDGSETQELWITGVPAGVSLSAGYYDASAATWKLTQAQANGLAVNAPSGWSEDLSLTLTARATEGGVTKTAEARTSVVLNAPPSAIVIAGSVPENAAYGAAAGTITGTDPDGDTLTYTLIDNAGGRFALSASGALTVTNGSLLDYESWKTHDIVVRASDRFGASRDQRLSVKVENINEAPDAPNNGIVDRWTGTRTVRAFVNEIPDTVWNFAGQRVTALTLSDVDGTTPTLVLSQPDDRFEVVGNELRFTSKAISDFEWYRDNVNYTKDNWNQDAQLDAHVANVYVRAWDGEKYSEDTLVQVFVSDVNERPTLVMEENYLFTETLGGESHVGRLQARFRLADPDGNAPKLKIIGGNDYGWFVENGTHIQVAGANWTADWVRANKGSYGTNAENSFDANGNGLFETRIATLTVVAEDASGARSNPFQYNIFIEDFNESPAFSSSNYTLSIYENSTWYVTVGSVANASDIDGPSTELRYGFSNAASYRDDNISRQVTRSSDGRFVMDEAGTIYVNGLTNLNYEGENAFAYSVTVADKSGGRNFVVASASLNINILDRDEQHQLLSDTRTISENLAMTTFGPVTFNMGANLRGEGANRYGNIRYKFANGALVSGNWSIDEGTGYITGPALDYEDLVNVYAYEGRYNAYSGEYETVPVYQGQDATKATFNLGVVAYNKDTGASASATATITVSNEDELPRLDKAEFFVASGTQDNIWRPGLSAWDDDGAGGYSSFSNLIVHSVERRAASPKAKNDDVSNGAPILKIAADGSISFDIPNNDKYWRGGLDGQYMEYVQHASVEASNVGGAPVRLYFDVVYLKRGFSGRAPVIIDLDGDGIEMKSLADSGVFFDMDDDGTADRTGWVGADDGMLALDRNKDGVINGGSEISFSSDDENAVSDIEGLRAFDTNKDGFLDKEDLAFTDFKIWQDRNQDGVSQAEELRSLEESEIARIGLSIRRNLSDKEELGENRLYATSDVIKSNGSVSVAGDVIFTFEPADQSKVERVTVSSAEEDPDAVAAPIILDLDKDGKTVTPLVDSQTVFDTVGDGKLRRTAWADVGDGFLVRDRNGNGKVDDIRDISFIGDKAGAKTDLEGLAAFDSNGDGLLDAQDQSFVGFGIWKDANSNGVTDAGEMLSLVQANIASIGLQGTVTGQTAEARTTGQSIIFNTGQFTLGDGTIGSFSDVGLAYATRVVGQSAAANVTFIAPGLTEGRKGDRFRIRAAGGSLSIRSDRVNGAVDADAGRLGPATLLTFADKTVGMLGAIVLDMDGDGLELQSRRKSPARFDMDGDGMADDTGWVGKGDGLLVIDRNGNGQIEGPGELTFLTEKAGLTSSFAGLALLDANKDGKLDAGDARFGELKVWVDGNRDGAVGEGELRSLGEADIASLSLRTTSLSGSVKPGENIGLATATYTRTDGAVVTMGEAALAFSPSSLPHGAARDADALGGAALAVPVEVPAEDVGSLFALRPEAEVRYGAANDALPVANLDAARMIEAMSSFGAARGGMDELAVLPDDRQAVFALAAAR